MSKNRFKTLAIIPARSGSKRLPGKNIKPLLEKPLVGWTVEQACRCTYFDKVIISTDCQKIANIANQFGAEVPFMRPAEISQDTSTSMEMIEHAYRFFLSQNETFDFIALLEPTSPLRTKEDLNQAMEYFIENVSTHDTLISVGKMEREHPSVMKKIDEKGLLNAFHHDKDDVFFPYGVIYVSKVSTLLKTKTFYQEKSLPYLIERWQNFEIDDEVDFMCIEKIMETYKDAL